MKRNFLILITLFFPLLNSGCKKEPDIYRLIDNLNETNVISSPLIDFEKNLIPVEQEWEGKDMFSLEIDDQHYWAVSTEKPVLINESTGEPFNMKVYRNETEQKLELLLSVPPEKDKSFWTLNQFEKTINPISSAIHSKIDDYIILSEREYFVSEDLFLPQGRYIFKIDAKSGEADKYCPFLSFSINNNVVDEILVGRGKYYVVTEIPTGRHNIKIGFNKLRKFDEYKGQEKLHLGNIHIKRISDLLLFYSPEDDQEILENDKFKATFVAAPEKKVLYFKNDDTSTSSKFSSTINLRKSNQITTEVDLESDYHVFEIICHAVRRKLLLTLLIDEKEIGQQEVLPWEKNSYYFETFTHKGKHTLTLKLQTTREKEIPVNFIYIHKMLVYPSRQWNLQELFAKKDLIRFNNNEINSNNHGLTAKLQDKNYTVDAILAPLKTEVSFETKIPNNGILEFGLGIWEESRKINPDKDENIRFSVLLHNGDNSSELYSHDISLTEYKALSDLLFDNIDLSPYAGKNVKISLITERANSPEKEFQDIGQRSGWLSYWSNPIIYTGTKDKRKPSRSKDPNVILISIDTLRPDHLGCYGYVRDTSPHIDKLAADGVLFENTFSHSPSTLPSHASMLSALYPIHNGILSQHIDIWPTLDPAIPLIGHFLKQKNYFSGAYTGGGYVSGKYGFSQGFDFYYENIYIQHSNDDAEKLYNRSAGWIEKNQGKKFFLFLHTFQVHSPYDNPEPYDLLFAGQDAIWKQANISEMLKEDGTFNRFKKYTNAERENLTALYDGGIRYTDEFLIKPLVAKLMELDLYDNTLIIFTSDHGEEFYDHGGWGHTHSLYNELIKVPLIIKLPKSKYKGRRIKFVSRIVDIVPTVLDVVGIDISKQNFDGASLMDSIKGKSDKRKYSLGFKYYYFEKFGKPQRIRLMNFSIASNPYKMILNTPYQVWDLLYKDPDTFPFRIDETELFDFIQDPAELKNLVKQSSNIQAHLSKILRPYYREAKDWEAEFKSRRATDDKMKERLRALGYIH